MSPTIGPTSTLFTFTAQLNGTAQTGCTYTYIFYFGDGGQTTVTSTSTVASTTHTYAAAGSYTATEQATSSPNGVTVTSGPVTVTVTTGGGGGGCPGIVSNVWISNSPNPSAVNIPVTCWGGATDTCPNNTLTYSWTFGDGTSGTGNPIFHGYGAPGTYNIVLTVTDTVSNNSAMQNSGQTVTIGRSHSAGAPPGTGYDIATHCAEDKVGGGASRATGNNQVTLSDPVPTRGYPLANNIYINCQVVETARPMGNAAFTYDVHLALQNIYNHGVLQQHLMLVDGQGTRLDYGTGTTYVSPPGVTANLILHTVNNAWQYLLTNAGPPDSIAGPGNFSYTFNGALQLLQITDPQGNTQTLSYGVAGIQGVTDDNTGKTLTFQWTGANITGITQNGGQEVTALTYSGGMLTGFSAKSSGGVTLERADLTYDSTYPTAIHSVEYDGDTTTISTFDYAPYLARDDTNTFTGAVPMLAHEYEAGNSNPVLTLAWTDTSISNPTTPYKLTQTNAKGGVTTLWFSPALDLVQLNQPLLYGQTTSVIDSYSYDSNHNMLTASDGTLQVSAAYNSNFMPTSFIDESQQIWNLAWNGFDLTSYSDPLHHGGSISYADPAQPHVATSVTDADGAVWTATHNPFGQDLLSNAPAGSPMGPVAVTYDENVNSASRGYPLAVTDGNGNRATIDQYDALGNVLQFSTYPYYGYTNTVHIAYDALQRPTVATLPDGNTLQNIYTGRNLTSTIDEAGSAYGFAYCPACGALESVSGPMGWGLSWGMDADHNVTSFTDANGHITRYRVGQGDETWQVEMPDGTAASLEYNDQGQLKFMRNCRAYRMYPRYNPDGSVYELNFSDMTEARGRFYYNTDGSVSSASAWVRYRDYPTGYNRRAFTYYTYTASGQVASVLHDYRNLAVNPDTTLITEELDYTYNTDGSRAGLTWKHNGTPVGTWNYVYDAAGRLTGLTNPWTETTSWTYDGENKALSQLDANGTQEAFTYYQQRGWPTDITWTHGGGSLAAYHLNYDNYTNGGTVGNLTHVSELDGSTVNYVYDLLYRLTSESRFGSNPESNSYGYDLAGNRTNVDGTNFTFDAANNLNQTTHDEDGDVLTDLEGNIYTWDSSSMTATIMGTNGIGVENEYDTDGRRIFAHQLGGTNGLDRVFVYDDDMLLGEVSLPSNGTGQAQVTAAYTWGALGLVSEHVAAYNGGAGTSYWYTFGPQGETRQLTNGTGTVVDAYTYTAYGYPAAGTHAIPNPFRYGGVAGYYTDPLTSPAVMLCGMRWYSAGLGAWLSRDPLFYDGGPNLFTYCDDNPVLNLDTSGLSQDMDKNGGPNTVRFSWAAFLRPVWTPIPFSGGKGYLGDGRDWSSNDPNFRLEINGRINLNTGHMDFAPATGITTLIQDDGRYYEVIKTAKAPTSDLRACGNKTARGYKVELTGAASNPLAPGSPPIEFHVGLWFDRRGKLTRIDGDHTLYPNMELWTYRHGAQPHQAYGYNPDKLGGNVTWLYKSHHVIKGLWP